MDGERTRIHPNVELEPPAEERHDGDEQLQVKGFVIKQWSPYDHLDFKKPKQLELIR